MKNRPPASIGQDAPPPPFRGPLARAFLGVCLVLVAFNLRPVFSSLSAVLPELLADLNLGAVFSSLATTVPVLCLGLFAPLAPPLARRFGPETTILALLLALAGGTALRGLGTAPAILVGQALAGAAIAVGNVLLPALVKRDFADRPALLTGFYTMALCGGAAVAAGVTVPLERLLGSAPLALGAWSLPALAVALLWLPQLAFRGGEAGTRRSVPRGLWRDPLAWQVTLFMGLQSSLAYIVFGWLAPILRWRGFDATEAGLIVSVSVFVQTGSCLLAPVVAVRRPDQRGINVALIACALVGLLGCLYAPLWSVWGFALLQGIGQGSLIAVAMTVIVLRSPDPPTAAALSSMAQTVGYAIAAAGPLLVGLISGATGSFAWAGLLVAALALGGGVAGYGAGRRRHVLAPRHPASA